jgi:hypothetical protein
LHWLGFIVVFGGSRRVRVDFGMAAALKVQQRYHTYLTGKVARSKLYSFHLEQLIILKICFGT